MDLIVVNSIFSKMEQNRQLLLPDGFHYDNVGVGISFILQTLKIKLRSHRSFCTLQWKAPPVDLPPTLPQVSNVKVQQVDDSILATWDPVSGYGNVSYYILVECDGRRLGRLVTTIGTKYRVNWIEPQTTCVVFIWGFTNNSVSKCAALGHCKRASSAKPDTEFKYGNTEKIKGEKDAIKMGSSFHAIEKGQFGLSGSKYAKEKFLKEEATIVQQDEFISNDPLLSSSTSSSKAALPSCRITGAASRPLLSSASQHTCVLKYVAKSASSGKVISTSCRQTSVSLEGIDPGDKYYLSVFEVKENSTETLIAKSEIQTCKVIGKDGGTVEVGNHHLSFPSGAVCDNTRIGICAYVQDAPSVPDECFSIAPVFDLQSSQTTFDEPVTCTLKTPYIQVEKPIEVEILCYQNQKWQKVSSSLLTEERRVVFKCLHFTPYALVVTLPFLFVKRLPMSFLMVTTVYCKQDDNFACVTCLDHDPIKLENVTELKDLDFFSPILSDKFSMKVGETLSYCLGCPNPSLSICEWEITLDGNFVNKWAKILQRGIEKIEGKNRINIKLETFLHGQKKSENSVNIKYPFVGTSDLSTLSTADSSGPSNSGRSTPSTADCSTPSTGDRSTPLTSDRSTPPTSIVATAACFGGQLHLHVKDANILTASLDK